jgi:hypothetical protein
MIIVIDDCFCDAASELRFCIHLLQDSFLSLQKWQYQIVVLIILYGGVLVSTEMAVPNCRANYFVGKLQNRVFFSHFTIKYNDPLYTN